MVSMQNFLNREFDIICRNDTELVEISKIFQNYKITWRDGEPYDLDPDMYSWAKFAGYPIYFIADRYKQLTRAGKDYHSRLSKTVWEIIDSEKRPSVDIDYFMSVLLGE